MVASFLGGQSAIVHTNSRLPPGSSIALTRGGRETTAVFHSAGWLPNSRERFGSTLFQPAPFRLQKGVNLWCAPAERHFPAFCAQPSGFPVFSQNIDTFEKYMFPGSSGKMQSLAWEQVPPVPICPETEQGRKNKERPILCIKIAFPSSASSATMYN